MRIGIDLMGGDTPPIVLFEAALAAAHQLDASASLLVLASPAVIDRIWSETPHLAAMLAHAPARIEFLSASDIIEPGDEPIWAVRHKKHSSLVTGIRLLKKRLLDAFVSAGNTGALLASATLSLPLLPTIKRPALLASLPTRQGFVAVIDVGGNVSCKAHHLAQFAQMGAAYQRCYRQIAKPTVGLLNIGVESKKGTSEVRQAYQMLQEYTDAQPIDAQTMSFIGNIEARDVFQGKVDVIVTDGFTGNVLLKASEGVSSFIFELLREEIKQRLPGDPAELFQGLRSHFNYDEYPGAILCGLDRLVIKCHGRSSSKGLLNSIKGAAQLISNGFITQMRSQFALQS